jgi:GntR family transcriptional regulator / MocR family aminotransferase
MSEQLFFFDPKPGLSLQTQIREMLLAAVMDGHVPLDKPLPSSRKMSQMLNVSRHTVVLVYEKLLSDGYLVSWERKGHFVNPDLDLGLINSGESITSPQSKEQQFDWSSLYCLNPSSQQNLAKPKNWRKFEYPFIFGQIDPELFPVAEWRDCTRQATSTLLTRDWLDDSVDADDPLLVEQLRTRVFPRRGIRCDKDEVLLTLGTQQSLYLLAVLLGGGKRTLGMENPGYVDVRNIFELLGAGIQLLDVDNNGIDTRQDLSGCDVIFTTPSHQSPTTVTLSKERRAELLEKAEKDNFVIIEDDYESELNFYDQPSPAIKSHDVYGRVIYVGSLSKTLSPGLRIGYLVAPKQLIRELRALRRLMLRHPPTNNQRTLALFLAGGHQDSLLRRLSQVYKERFGVMQQAIAKHLPYFRVSPSNGGSALWLEGPKKFSASQLQEEALERGVYVEIGNPHFAGEEKADNFLRLGYSAIATEKIFPGIKLLGEIVKEQLKL